MSRRVIVIKSPDRHLFEEAIFIVRDEALRVGGLTGDDIIKQAQEVADRYVRCHLRRNLLVRLPAPVFAVLGSVFTALGWVLALYVF